MKRYLVSFGALMGMMIAAVACGGSESGSGNGATGQTSGSGAAGVGGGVVGTCDPACQAPQFCSVEHRCIDEGTCAGDGDCSEGLVCDKTSSQCVPGGGCGSQEAKAEAVPPNMLIVLDRSCSMKAAVANSTKWQIAVSAINKMTTDYDSKIRFGMTLFPDLVDPKCDQAAIPIPVGLGNETKIQTLLTASLAPADPYYPDGPCVTNIDTAMQQAAGEPSLKDATRDSYVLLITDGKQYGCSAAGGDTGTTQIIKNLYQNDKVATFVLGFGAQIDPAQMNIFADAGGVPNSDPNDPTTHYYKAEDQASLDSALASIASKTLGCTFSLDKQPPDANKIYVFFDNDPAGIPKDTSHAYGWDYDPATNEVIFYGAACDALKAGQVSDVDIVFGCNQPTPE